MNKWSFTEALQIISGKNISYPKKKIVQPIIPASYPEMPEDKISWLTEKRKISEVIVEMNRVGYQNGLYTFPYFKNNKLINKEVDILGDYLFCFHKNFSNKSTINQLKFSRGLKYFLDGFIEFQIDVKNFIEKCKNLEDFL